MPTFLSIPNEIKVQIIEGTVPDGIENFALCCRLIYDLAEKTLTQHRADKGVYMKLDVLFLWHGFRPQEPSDYEKLRVLSGSRRHRLYPRSVRLVDCTVLDEGIRRGRNTQVIRSEIRHVCDSIFNKLDSPYMDKSEIKTLVDKIDAGEVGAANSMLLTLLPNVKRINLCRFEHHNNTMFDTISKISRVNEKASSSMQEKFSLVKLEELHVYSQAYRYENESGMLEAFMTLPSLRVVRGLDLRGNYTFDKWLYPDQCSNVTELHFRQCALAVPDLARLFKHLKALQVFSYEHYIHREVPTKDYNVRALIDELYTHAGKTLVFLDYTTNDRSGTRGDLWLSRPGTLSKFSALKTLRMSLATMLNECGTPWQLVKQLPPSLEELEIVDVVTRRVGTLMFDGMLSMKQTLLPKLRLVVFERDVPFDDETIAAYERVGLVLDHRDWWTNMTWKSGKESLGGVVCRKAWWLNCMR